MIQKKITCEADKCKLFLKEHNNNIPTPQTITQKRYTNINIHISLFAFQYRDKYSLNITQHINKSTLLRQNPDMIVQIQIPQFYLYNNLVLYQLQMAKSLRSKVKKRWRALKKNYLTQVKVRPELQLISKNLEATIVGVQYRKIQSQNAFLHPQDSSAQFPQWAPKKNIDLRSTSIPGSGREYAGASRKYMSTQPKTQVQQGNDMKNEVIVEQIKIQRSLIKKDKNKKSKLRKLMVF